jgi:hypothetical protein
MNRRDSDVRWQGHAAEEDALFVRRRHGAAMVQGDDEVKVSGGGGDVGAAGILGLGARQLGSLAARDGGRHRAAGEVDFDFDV